MYCLKHSNVSDRNRIGNSAVYLEVLYMNVSKYLDPLMDSTSNWPHTSVCAASTTETSRSGVVLEFSFWFVFQKWRLRMFRHWFSWNGSCVELYREGSVRYFFLMNVSQPIVPCFKVCQTRYLRYISTRQCRAQLVKWFISWTSRQNYISFWDGYSFVCKYGVHLFAISLTESREYFRKRTWITFSKAQDCFIPYTSMMSSSITFPSTENKLFSPIYIDRDGVAVNNENHLRSVVMWEEALESIYLINLDATFCVLENMQTL